MLANCLAAHSTKAHWLMSISKIWVVIKIPMKCFEIIVDPYFDYLVFKDGLQSVTCNWICRLNSTEQNRMFIFLILIKTFTSVSWNGWFICYIIKQLLLTHGDMSRQPFSVWIACYIRMQKCIDITHLLFIQARNDFIMLFAHSFCTAWRIICSNLNDVELLRHFI